MIRTYLIYGLAVCGLMGFANYAGWTVADSATTGRWGPAGHNVYHK